MKLKALLTGLLLGLPLAPATHAVAPTNAPVVYAIPIHGMIEPALLYVIRRGVAEAHAADARAVVFLMDTPGGTVDAATDIVRTIQSVKVPTYTLVENHAFSAGAIIALSTKQIYMTPGAVIGDAMPILMTPWGTVEAMPDDIKEKSVSGVAALIRSAAQQSGHDPELAEKMVRRETELKIAGVVICPSNRLLTLTNIEAERKIGQDQKALLSAGTVKDLRDLLTQVGLAEAEVRELDVTAAERIARWIAALAPLFLMAGLLGLYIEFKTPGVVLPGVLGVLCLAIFFWGHHIAGLAGWEDMLLFLVGVGLVIAEIFFFPGLGLLAVFGAVLMFWALLSAMLEHLPGSPWYPTWPEMQPPIFKLGLALILAGAGALVLGRYLPATPLFRRLVLETRQAGYQASAEDTSALLGLTGTALTMLRPAGSAQFGERRLDVVTRGDFLPAGTPLRIVEAQGNHLVVEKV
ncbi:MAG: nodulation protein NfeD [Verrucomicrobia bacterium]|nr:MAG: nodulation protein NfeD [Verrucomicrobiota bacterium]